VTLFTRPRRFGKTLNMSMIKYFFDVRNKDENRKLFEELKIFGSEYMKEQGKYPVIFVSLKDLRADTWEMCLMEIKKLISKIYREFQYITEKMNEDDKEIYDSIKNRKNDMDLNTSIELLSEYLFEYYGERVIILIDEYDAPIINAFDKGYYNEAINFFQVFYSSALKTNDSLKYGILTGITRIIKEEIFSGLNNLKVDTILNKKFSEYFGLLESEVIKMLDYFEMKYKIEEVKEWYNGYIFGDKRVYNPWSIINYVDNGEIKAYWANVSGNTLLENMLDQAGEDVYTDLKRFTDGESIEKYISDGTTIKSLLSNDDEIWQLFLYSGYLTKAKEQIEIDETSEYTNIYNLKIPNKEIRKYFGNMFLNRFFGTELKTSILIKALESGDIKKFEKTLGEIMVNMLSHFDLDSEIEKKYDTRLKARGIKNILKIGIAFYGKKVKVFSK